MQALQQVEHQLAPLFLFANRLQLLGVLLECCQFLAQTFSKLLVECLQLALQRFVSALIHARHSIFRSVLSPVEVG